MRSVCYQLSIFQHLLLSEISWFSEVTECTEKTREVDKKTIVEMNLFLQ